MTTLTTTRPTAPGDAPVTADRAPEHPPVVTDAELDRAAWAIELDGLAGREGLIDRLAARAVLVGASPVLIDVLTDRREPEVARIRAFGLLALQVAGRSEQPFDALAA